MTCNYIYISDFNFNITKKNNSIQISIFNNDKVSKQEMHTYSFSGDNMTKTKHKFEVLDIKKVIFIRQNIKRDYNNYCLKNSLYEFKGFRDEDNTKKNTTISNYIEYNEKESIKDLENLIKNLKYNKNNNSHFNFYNEYYGSGNSNQMNFNNPQDYHFTLEVPLFDDASFYHIVITKNNINKNKIINFFETYLKMILSINPTYIPKPKSKFSSITY